VAHALERIPPQLEAPQEASEDADTVEEAPDRTERAPIRYRRAFRRAHGGAGGVGCSVGRKKGGTPWMTQTPRGGTAIRTSPQKRDEPWQDTAWP
jgi:hypothetical protein